MDEDRPWVSLAGTEQDMLALRAEVNDYRKREKTVVMTINVNTSTCNGNKKKEDIKDNIREPDNYMVGGIPKWKLKPKGANPGETMVCNGTTYYWCPNRLCRVIWVCRKPENCNVKVEANTNEEEKDNGKDIDK